MIAKRYIGSIVGSIIVVIWFVKEGTLDIWIAGLAVGISLALLIPVWIIESNKQKRSKKLKQ